MDLAIRCIDYLCQRHHDVDLSPEEVFGKVLTGQYSFHAFSTQMWFELSCQYLRLANGVDPPTKFVESLHKLWAVRKTHSSQTAINIMSNGDREVDSYEVSRDQIIFEQLKGNQPLLHQLLCEVSRFRNSSFLSTGRSDHGTFSYHELLASWKHDFQTIISLAHADVCLDPHKNECDPLSTSELSQRIHGAFDQALCAIPCGRLPDGSPGCHEDCAVVLYYYGTQPFKCKFFQCEFWRHGFETRDWRNKHEHSHDLPLKCHIAGCVFALTGFLSETMRQKHLQKDHRNDHLQPVFEAQNIPTDDVEPLLLQLIRENRANDAWRVVTAYSSAIKLEDLHNFQKIAANVASREMLEVLEQADHFSHHGIKYTDFDECIIESMRGRNMGTLEYLLAKTSPLESKMGHENFQRRIDIMCQVVSSDWLEGTEMWCNWHQESPLEDTRVWSIKDLLLKRKPITQAGNHPGGEQQLLYIWNHRAFFPRFKRPNIMATEMLKAVAGSTCSITLAKYLLENGADVNARRLATVRTALHFAACHNNARSAEMMRFLLLNGADPEANMAKTSQGGRKGRRIRDEVGPMHIHRWLGKNWDELVGETTHIRQSKEVGKALLTNMSE